jgi:23S rRNA pseudouridine2605 synthase
MSLRVSLEADTISLDGVETAPDREPIVIALHKPVGYVTTRHDPQGRPTVYQLLPDMDRFVFPVGRLDKDTSGLLILTDDHRLGETLTNPDSRIPKIYEVLLDRRPDVRQLEALRKGIGIGNGEVTRPARIETLASGDTDAAVTITISEGKNRQVRRMVSAVGLAVVTLSRVGIGEFRLRGIPLGGHLSLSPLDAASLLRKPKASSI